MAFVENCLSGEIFIKQISFVNMFLIYMLFHPYKVVVLCL